MSQTQNKQKKHLRVVVVTFFILTFGGIGEKEHTFVFVQYLTITLSGGEGLFFVLAEKQQAHLTVVQQPVPKTLTNTKSKVKIIAYQSLER